MLKSMTAYGRSQIETHLGRFVVEIQSVNRKYLEINLSLPKELSRFDPTIRKWIGERIHRGQVNVRVFANFEQGDPITVRPNLALAKKIRGALSQVAKELQVDESIGLDVLTAYPDLLLFEEDIQDEKNYLDQLQEVVGKALDSAVEMKMSEGKALHYDLSKRLELIKSQLVKIKQVTNGTVDRYQEKLKKRLKEAFEESVEDERILREVCLFADRVDITEELIRLDSHLDQCEKLMQSDVAGIGKTIDFIAQELGREANTIGSKVVDMAASRFVVEMKGEIEKIRQQAQNVE